MRKTIYISALALVAVIAAPRLSHAGGSKGSIGVGGEASLGSVFVGSATAGFDFGLGGVSANYDAGAFHVGGFLGFSDGGGDDDTDVMLGGRFYYHVHSTAMADFGVGGNVGLGFFGDRTPAVDDNSTVMLIEPGLQIRAFIASNVALSFTAGITMGLIDAEGVAVTAQPNGSAGFHYYFF